MTLPHSPDAERSLLSCLLGSQEAHEVVPELRPDDFYLPLHRNVFDAIAELVEERRPVDPVTVGDRIEAADNEQAALLDIATAAPYWHNFRAYAETVMRDGTARRLITACTEIASRAHVQDPQEVLAAARLTLAELEGRSKGGPVRIGERLSDVLAEVEARGRGERTPAISSGIASYDRLFGQFRPEQLVVVAARPGIGKTAFAGCVALRAARRGEPALVFSLEMSFTEMAERMIGAQARVSVEAIGRGMTGQPMQRLFHDARGLEPLPLWVDDRLLTIGQITAAARVWRAKNPGPRALVVIDYLGLVRTQGKSERRDLEVGRIAWGAKALAKELACPVMLVSQLNRQPAIQDREPMLSDLRDSGEIEQHAHVVIFPHRLEPLEASGPAEIHVGKNRNGMTGKVSCYWHAETMVFDELQEERDERRYVG